MNVERKLQINLAVMVALGSGLLGVAQSNVALPAAGVVSALVALIFTDIRQSFRLNRLLANTVALAAVVVVLLDFLTATDRSQLLAIANLLICLQIVLLFQEKTPRIYGHLAVLSLLQVVVSAALRVGVEFGALLLVYMVVAVSFLALLFNFRTVKRVMPPRTPPGESESPATAIEPSVSTKPLAILFGQPPRAQFIYREEEFSQQLTGWRLPRQIAGICFATVLFSVILFLSLPRSREDSGTLFEQSRTVGMPTEIALDEMHNIIASDASVMRVRFSDAQTGERFEVFGDLYLRGIILDYYAQNERGKYVWSSSPDEAATRLASPPPGVPGVNQHTVLQPQQSSTLFAVYPAYQSQFAPDRLNFDRNTKRLVRVVGDTLGPPQTLRYTVFTTGFQNNLQRTVTPHEFQTMYPAGLDGNPDNLTPRGRRRLEQMEEEFREEIEHLAYITRRRFPNITALAEKIAAETREIDPQADRASIARALQNHFLFSTEYTYTLDFSQVSRTPGMDPIEDFVAHNRSGHCEYFASALVLALRTQGIPARMVVGYRGGEYNSLGNFYQIRQNNAHAWVEAYLEPDQVSESQLPAEKSTRGAWMRLDPTPVGGEVVDWSKSEGVMAWANDAYGFARLMWMDYVVNMNSQRQQDAIYDPIASGNEMAESLFSLGSGESESDEAASQGAKRIAMVWRIAGGLIVLLIAVIAVYRISRSIKFKWRRRKKKVEKQAAAARRGPPVPFYERFAELLARHDLKRRPSQTQAEFASSVGRRMTVTPALSEVAVVPRRVVEAFYDVRFGAATLSPEQLSQIEQDLDQLDAALVSAQQSPSSNPPSTPHPRDNGRTSTTAS
ncbi:MAG: DUF3488 and transglutaminase-like domain-containing protein [Pirellulaceae bacterium]